MAETTNLTITSTDGWTAIATDVPVALTISSNSQYAWAWFIGSTPPDPSDEGHLLFGDWIDNDRIFETGSFVGTLYIRTVSPYNHKFAYTEE